MRKAAATILLSAALTAPAFAGPGLTAAPSLNAPLGPRSFAMGQAFTAVKGGGESVGYNPGALAFSKGYAVTAAYMRGFKDVGHGLIAAPLNFGRLTVTPSYLYFNGGEIDLNLSDGTTGKVNAETDTAAGVSAAWLVSPVLGVGATAKRVRVELAETASAAAMVYDIGALLDAGGGFSFGAALMNSGGSFKFEQDGDPSPAVTRLGAAFLSAINPPNLLDPDTDIIDSEMLLTADWIRPAEEKGYLQCGLDLAMKLGAGVTTSLRFGYLFNRPAEGFTLGFGVDTGRWSFDVALGSPKEMNARQQAGASYRF